MCLSQLSLSEVTGSEKNLVAQLVSRLSLSETMVQGRTSIGQLVSQLSLSEKCGSGDFTVSYLNSSKKVRKLKFDWRFLSCYELIFLAFSIIGKPCYSSLQWCVICYDYTIWGCAAHLNMGVGVKWNVLKCIAIVIYDNSNAFWHIRGCTIRGYNFFYKYHVINHKGNWLGTFLDKFWMNREKLTRAGFEHDKLPFALSLFMWLRK